MPSVMDAFIMVAGSVAQIGVAATGAAKALSAANDEAKAYAATMNEMHVGTGGGPSVIGVQSTGVVSLGDPKSASDYAAGMVAALEAATRR